MMKQKDIAGATGLTSSYICELVSTKKRPAYKTAKKLSKVTGIDVLIWLEGSKEEIKAAIKGKTTKGKRTCKVQ